MHDDTDVRLIHMVWLGEMKPLVETAVNRMSRLNPGHRVVLHTDMTEVFPGWKGVMDKHCRSHLMGSDFVRQSMLRKHGGWYFDMDVTPVVPVDEMLGDVDLGKYNAWALDVRSWVSTDILYCPVGWSGWKHIDEYMSKYNPDRQGIVDFAHTMLMHVARRDRECLNVVQDMKRYPAGRKHLGASEVAAYRSGLDESSKPLPKKRKRKFNRKSRRSKPSPGIRPLMKICEGCASSYMDDKVLLCKHVDMPHGKNCLRSRISRYMSILAMKNCPEGKFK